MEGDDRCDSVCPQAGDARDARRGAMDAMEAVVEVVAGVAEVVAPQPNCSAVRQLTADWPDGPLAAEERFLRGTRFLIQVRGRHGLRGEPHEGDQAIFSSTH